MMDDLKRKLEPFDLLFNEAFCPLEYIKTNAELVFACEQVLRLPSLGITKHLVTMIKKAADSRTPLTDRLALRAVLAGDDQRAARIWRREFAGQDEMPTPRPAFPGACQPGAGRQPTLRAVRL
jgi:hypothetical protein